MSGIDKIWECNVWCFSITSAINAVSSLLSLQVCNSKNMSQAAFCNRHIAFCILSQVSLAAAKEVAKSKTAIAYGGK